LLVSLFTGPYNIGEKKNNRKSKTNSSIYRVSFESRIIPNNNRREKKDNKKPPRHYCGF